MSGEQRALWLDHAASCEECHAIAVVDAASEHPTSPLPDTSRIGRFTIERELGRGAMGIVYAAIDPELDRPIAIKVLHAASAGERLRREARALARLDHPNVVRVYDVGTFEDRAFVAMELIPGTNMRRWLADEPRSRADIVAALTAAGRGLAAAHAAGIVHRDFKPDNVFVARERVVVGDFGLSWLDGAATVRPSNIEIALGSQSLTANGVVIGTPAYMAPEQVRGDATAASDQFAFCVTAWEALFGRRPFAGATMRELSDHAAAGRFVRPPDIRVPRRLERALRRGLSVRAEDRFPTMDALLAAMAPRSKRPWIAAGGGVLAIAVGLVALRASEATPPDPCEQLGDAIHAQWTDAARARIRETRGAAALAELDAYAAAWRDKRRALCRMQGSATAELEQRAAREACFERARIEFLRLVQERDLSLLERHRTVPLAACESMESLPQAPGTAADPRGCGCPYSPCDEQQRCTSECSARAFKLVGPIEGIAVRGRQEAVSGATRDGARLLYLAGPRCALDHLYIADRAGAGYTSTDLTPQLVARGVTPHEGCCTLSGDGRTILAERDDRPGLVELPLDGTRVGAADPAPYEHLFGALRPGDRVQFPVLGGDHRTLYLTLITSDERHGTYVATRAEATRPFAPAVKVHGRAAQYDYATGMSGDERTLFMASEYMTRALLRSDRDQPFGDLGIGIPPATLPGWRTIPIDGCRRLIATVTPGGCESEDTVLFEAVDP